ncbi:primase-helicase zinc-binding domain-containing protein [Shewanella mangrovisoli]|uniref:primase-helicase zinc-binding domain-containing protein n=1 Tax=Shewanella mangrovisoli TaxID=2864211 RepID=UPI0035B846B5
MNNNSISTLVATANGHWFDVLNGLGISIHVNKHQPCPVCGGKDRFRFDDKDGRGTWFCNQCEPNSGDGLALVCNAFGIKPYQAALMVAPFVGLDMAQPIDTGRVKRHQQRAEQQQLQRQLAQQQTHQRAAQLAYDITRQHCRVATAKNQYLQVKGVLPFGSLQLIRSVTLPNSQSFKSDTLIIPVLNGARITSLQFIGADGQKTFLAGGQMKGGMFPLCNRIDATGTIYIGEGFATCAAVAEDMPQSQVICAFNAGGLVDVAKQVRRSRPQANIIILADNDPSGTGEHYARLAAIAVNGSYIMPEVSA